MGRTCLHAYCNVAVDGHSIARAFPFVLSAKEGAFPVVQAFRPLLRLRERYYAMLQTLSMLVLDCMSVDEMDVLWR